MNVERVLEEWALYWSLEGRAPNTMRDMRYVIRPLLERHEELTLRDVMAWIAEAESLHVRRMRGQTARAFCRWATAEEVGDYGWWKRIPLTQVPAKDQATVTEAEMKVAYARCDNARDRALVSVLWCSGMRVSEICRMRIEHVDLALGRVLIPKSKAHKPRTAPLSRQARQDLYRLLRNDPRTEGPLWIGRKGQPLGTSGVNQMLRRIGASAAHSWRRGWAVEARRRNISPMAIQTAAGWNDNGLMLRRYTRKMDSELSLAEFDEAWSA